MVNLPLIARPSDTGSTENRQAVKESRAILVVEDDDIVFSLVRRALLEVPAGYAVRRLTAGELTNMLAAGQSGGAPGGGNIQALVLDEASLKPESVGILSSLRTHPAFARVPTVMLVHTDDERRISEYQTMGASICILKPGEEDAILETISKLGSFLAVVQVP